MTLGDLLEVADDSFKKDIILSIHESGFGWYTDDCPDSVSFSLNLKHIVQSIEKTDEGKILVSIYKKEKSYND